MKTVLVLGATGSVGRSLVDYFAKQSDVEQVVAVSRRIQPSDMPNNSSNVQTIAVDLLDADAVKAAFRPLSITHVIFSLRIESEANRKGKKSRRLPHPNAVHRQLAILKPFLCILRGIDPVWKTTMKTLATAAYANDPDQYCVRMLDHALDALMESPMTTQLEQVSLITGGKYSGAHMGPYFHPNWQLPLREDDPRPLGPNFYYDLIDRLQERCASGEDFRYVDFRPHFVIGFGAGSSSSIVTALAVYAWAQKYQGLPLRFPGTKISFEVKQEFSDVRLLGALIHHVMDTTPSISGEGFHSVNGNPASWSDVWPGIAAYFGMEWELEPHGFAVGSYLEKTMSVWPDMVKEYGLKPYTWQELIGVDFFTKVMAYPAWSVEYSLEKVRGIGFTETIDNDAMFTYYFNELSANGIIPPPARVHQQTHR